MKQARKAQVIGRHIVADPKICHGKPTFRGSRVLVADVLDQVAAGMAWETIVEEWNGSISKDAIREAIQSESICWLPGRSTGTLLCSGAIELGGDQHRGSLWFDRAEKRCQYFVGRPWERSHR